MPSRSTKFRHGRPGGDSVAFASGGKTEKPARRRAPTKSRRRPNRHATTTEKDQTDLSVTVYNSNLALVRDVRQIHLQSGVFPLRFEDVAASINPATVHFRSLTDPAKLSVVEQNYEYDLLDPQKLLQKYVGREVTLVRAKQMRASTKWVDDESAAARRQQRRTGLEDRRRNRHGMTRRVLSLSRSARQISTAGRRWSGRSKIAARTAQRVEASYLTGNMNWSADYVLTVARDEKTADLDGWVTLVNNSGAAYTNAKLQLVAGEVHRTATAGRDCDDAANGGGQDRRGRRRNFRRRDFPNITCTRSSAARRSRTTSRSRSACSPGRIFPWRNTSRSKDSHTTTATRRESGTPIPQPVKVFYRFKNDEKSESRHAAARGNRARVSGRFEGRHAIRRRGHDRPHAEGRDAAHLRRQRIRRGVRAQADGLQEARARSVRDGVPDHAAESQGRAGDGGSARADRRRLGSGELELQVDETRCDDDRISKFRSRRTERRRSTIACE